MCKTASNTKLRIKGKTVNSAQKGADSGSKPTSSAARILFHKVVRDLFLKVNANSESSTIFPGTSIFRLEVIIVTFMTDLNHKVKA